MVACKRLISALQPAAFLDRDGVINFDRAYVCAREQFEFIPGVFEAARALRRHGYLLVVITNQSGIGRGFCSEDDFRALDNWMRTRFHQEGASVAATYFCPHHPSDAIDAYRRLCECRKPRPGMLFRAASEHGIALKRSLMVGDKISDLQAAQAAGIPVRLLVGTDGLVVPPQPSESGLATACFQSLVAAVASLESTLATSALNR